MFFMGAISGMIGVLGTMFGQWLNRDKTKAEAMTLLANTLVEALSSFTDQRNDSMKALNRREDENDELRREAIAREEKFAKEIADVRADLAAEKTTIRMLELNMAGLVESNAEKDKQIASLIESSEKKDVQIAVMETKISTLETERIQLLATVADMGKRLEAKEAVDGNGNIVTDGAPDETVTVENTPEVDKTGDKVVELAEVETHEVD